jgi:hypothetical protein
MPPVTILVSVENMEPYAGGWEWAGLVTVVVVMMMMGSGCAAA